MIDSNNEFELTQIKCVTVRKRRETGGINFQTALLLKFTYFSVGRRQHFAHRTDFLQKACVRVVQYCTMRKKRKIVRMCFF